MLRTARPFLRLLNLSSLIPSFIPILPLGDLSPGSQDDLPRHARPVLPGEEGLQHGGQTRGEGDHGEEVYRGKVHDITGYLYYVILNEISCIR